ncbi:MAG TPA: AtpZ/AtpI family protein [Thermoanaerobaculia bacterium]|nr:AtpZ/AtpI family protein [Thermoanaerobaculia bacterium]
MSEKAKPGANLARLSGLGIELAAAVAGFVAVGYWWDRHFGTSPWGIVGWGSAGLVGGLYNLIRQSLLAFKEEAGTKRDGGPKR